MLVPVDELGTGRKNFTGNRLTIFMSKVALYVEVEVEPVGYLLYKD